MWDRKESLEFLKNELKLKPEEETTANELANELGDLPLAIDQAVAYIRENDESINTYLKLFREIRTKLLEEESILEAYKHTVATTWTLAMEKVKETAGAKALLTLCAFLAPDDIPLDIIGNSIKEVVKVKSKSMLGRFHYFLQRLVSKKLKENSSQLLKPLADVLKDPIKQIEL